MSAWRTTSRDPGSRAFEADRDPCPVCASGSTAQFCTASDRVLQSAGRKWRILRCTGCGCGWTSPRPDPSEIAAYYPATYLGDTRSAVELFLAGKLTAARSWRDQAEKVVLLEKSVRRGRILDVGCGDGRFLWGLDPGRWRRTGVEFAAPVVEIVRSRMPDLDLIAGDIFTERLPQSSFDVLTMWHVLEHLHDPQAVLRRAHGLLEAGGWLFISVPNIAGLQALIFRSHWYGFDDVPRHLYHFSPQALRLLLEGAGFHDLRFRFFSRRVAFHSLKHSARNWCRHRSAGLVLYYCLKPLLRPFQLLEAITGRYSILTVACRKA